MDLAASALAISKVPRGRRLRTLSPQSRSTLCSNIKATQAKLKIEVCAIRSDCDIMGPPDDFFGIVNEDGTIENEGMLQFLLNELAEVDLMPDQGHFRANFSTPTRAHIAIRRNSSDHSSSCVLSTEPQSSKPWQKEAHTHAYTDRVPLGGLKNTIGKQPHTPCWLSGSSKHMHDHVR